MEQVPDKILIELYSRVIELENTVKTLNDKIDSMQATENAKKIKYSNKYMGITSYLKKAAVENKREVTLTIKEIAELIGAKELPDSAYKHLAFWANSDTHSIALSWKAAGYKVHKKNIKTQVITFRKIGE